MAEYSERELRRGLKGRDVEELQIRLAGFRGTIPDGIFGPGTELQVIRFQRDFMKIADPSGAVDSDTLDAIDRFAEGYSLDFQPLECPCGVCDGFGQARFKGEYREGKADGEKYYLYEYPGIHRMLLWAVRAMYFYMPDYKFIITSGYRCGVKNEQEKRKSTNHHGKAIDMDVIRAPGEDKRTDMNRCERIRGIVVETAGAQIGWNARNRKALEPASIAPTWVHYDVRCYEQKYLEDRFFCKSLEELNGGA